MGFLAVVSPAEALERLRAAVSPRPAGREEVCLADALGRVAAVDAGAEADVPGFARSIVDGYAVRAQDTFGAGPEQPAYLELAGEVTIGRAAGGELAGGKTMAIPTGGMLPPGADAVVMMEHTSELGGGTVEVLRPAAPGENVMAADEDIRAGEVVVRAGRRLFPADLGALAAAGVTTVEVFVVPRVAVLSTGDELVPPEESPRPGQVRDVNAVTLAAALARDGARVVRWPTIVPDREEDLRQAVSAACREADLVLLSGGSSVGRADLVPRVLDGLGPPGVLAHGLNIRPGKPTVVAVCGAVPALGLPGHPVSAVVVYEVLVRPLLRLLAGESGPLRAPTVIARIDRNVPVRGGIEEYVRVVLAGSDDGLWAEPVLGKSGAINTLARADGLVTVPATRRGLHRGDQVEVRLLRW